MMRYRFILSYMTTEREGIVSLFLFDDYTQQINSDMFIILAQSLLHLGTVQEADEGDNTPPARTKTVLKYNQLNQAEEYTPNFKEQPAKSDDHTVQFEELKQSSSGGGSKVRKNTELLGGFSTLAASES